MMTELKSFLLLDCIYPFWVIFKWKGAHEIERNAFCSSSGLPFIPYLDNLPNFNRSVDGPIRLPIVDKYKVQIKIIGLKV